MVKVKGSSPEESPQSLALGRHFHSQNKNIGAIYVVNPLKGKQRNATDEIPL
jgi:hypothetical protein